MVYLKTGDRVTSICAQLSPTMCYVMECLARDPEKSLKNVIDKAIELGITGEKAVSRMIEDFTGVTAARKVCFFILLSYMPTF